MKVADLFAKLGLQVDKRQWSQGNALISGAKKLIIGLVAIKTARWFGGMIRDVRESADNYNKFSKSVGISSEALQQLEFAAKIGGTNVQVLGKGIQRLARTSLDARNGLKSALLPFEQLFGNRATGKRVASMTDLDKQLMIIADRFEELPDSGQKTALAMQIFGRAGAELIPFLNEGSAGIAELREEFVALGGQIDEQTGAEFEQLNDDMLRVETVIKGVKQQLVIALLPVLKELTDSMLVWVKANKKLLRQRVRTFARGLATILRLLVKAIGFVIDNWKLLLFLWGVSKSLGTILALIKAIRAAQLAFALLGWGAVRAGLKTAVAWIVAAWPFVLIGIIIAALILIIEDLYTWIEGGDSVLKDLWLAAKKYIGDKLRQVWDDTFNWMEDRFVEFFEWFIPELEKLGEMITDAFDFVFGAVSIDQDKAEKIIEKRKGERRRLVGLPSTEEIRAVNADVLASMNNITLAIERTEAPQPNITVNNDIKVEGVSDPVAAAEAVSKEMDKTLRAAAAGIAR